MWVWSGKEGARKLHACLLMNTDGDSDIRSLCLDLSSPHTCKYCMFPSHHPHVYEQVLNSFTSPSYYVYQYTDTELTDQAIGPSEPSGALMEVNELFLASPPLLLPQPIFISLRLFWSSGVISQTKCLSAHKGRWLICFNTSICHVSCLLLHGVWKGSLASTGISRLASISTPPAGEAHGACVCSHVNICLCTYVRV